MATMNNMTTLIIGASGATGKKLVEQLVDKGQKVRAIVRSPEKLPAPWKNNEQIIIIKDNISEISKEKMAEYIKDCHAVASCLGHNLTRKGIYGKPRKLVTDAVRLLCDGIVINLPERTIKLVLMNTAGNSNRDLNEAIPLGQRLIIGLLRLLLPPHTDNENAADHLRVNIGQNNQSIEWVVVRPDSLINESSVSPYKLFPSPVRSALFNPGKTSRINVGHFMAQLITDNGLWHEWKGQMPVIYNTEEKKVK